MEAAIAARRIMEEMADILGSLSAGLQENGYRKNRGAPPPADSCSLVREF